MKRRDFIKTSSALIGSTIAFPSILTAKNKYPTIIIITKIKIIKYLAIYINL